VEFAETGRLVTIGVAFLHEEGIRSKPDAIVSKTELKPHLAWI
jgi:hypothetical protein